MLIVDKMNNSVSIFNTVSGYYLQIGRLVSYGRTKETGTFTSSYPELLDIGIMGHCNIGGYGICLSSGIQCYQDGLHQYEPNMSLCDYKRIIEESMGRTFQVILGGRGDPDKHEDFGEILRYAREKGIIPSYTSSGFHLNNETVQLSKAYCKTVAISFHNQFYTYRAIRMLLDAGVETNIHFVLSTASIDDAIRKLENNSFPEGINAVVFLLHKPVGLGGKYNILNVKDERVRKFFKLISRKHFSHGISFDSCSVPGIINFADHTGSVSTAACEGARWSAYISPRMEMMPCSFCIGSASWSYSIKDDTVENAWRSEPFNRFRDILAEKCPECSRQKDCLGGCPILPEVVLCNREEREYNLN